MTPENNSNNEEKLWQDAAAMDTIKALGEMPEDEYEYYMNLEKRQNNV